ncbi:MAG TPA: GGDEF domain-containing protein [Ilumatobacter sp.]|nr:GGDEF domain-containing protein [Ilumatobacter sp.]
MATVLATIPALSAGATADVTGSVRTIAERAAEAAAEEQNLLQIAGASNLDAADRAEVEERIRSADARGVELLEQLDRLDVDLSQAIRISLSALPPAEDRLLEPGVYVPPPAVYEAAAADLLRIAETPESVARAPASSGSPSFGLLAVAAVALLTLGAAAFGNSLRRQPRPRELGAWSDDLTGLGSRERLDADLALYEGSDRPTAAIMVDVDHFEDINERFGQTVGDEVLRKVGDALAAHVRSRDVVYRSGGEEFCILLHGASTSHATDIAERIVNGVREVELPDGDIVTVSVGVAGEPHGDAIDAVRRADEALHSAKELGRDRAVAAEDHSLGV